MSVELARSGPLKICLFSEDMSSVSLSEELKWNSELSKMKDSIWSSVS